MRSPHLFQSLIACLLVMIGLLTLETEDDGRSHHGKSGRLTFVANGGRSPAKWLPSMAAETLGGAIAGSASGIPGPDADPAGDGGAPPTAGIRSAAFAYGLGAAEIRGAAGSMRRETPLSITGLGREQTPPLGAGMVNVTGTHNAYRMLPAGMVFNNDIAVALPYDSALLPPGHRPEEIMTYYYNEARKRWIAIERDSVDAANGLVISRVDHFTDFINAVVKTPEMPETQAHAPTAVAGLQAADPLEGVTLVQAPVPNNGGTASLHYPIGIPAGRLGMQPALAAVYGSGGGNGWMGAGWDIPVPAVTVETRWGVPRYDALLESEDYLLNGQQLVTKNPQGEYEPLVHRGDWRVRKNGAVRFHARVEGAFLKIIRHGNSPDGYWWEARDKNGTVYYYGKHHREDIPSAEATLRDALGNIAKWPLTETRDLYGNTVKYAYETVAGQHGKAVYLKSVTYTGFGNEEGKYRVDFARASRQSLDLKDFMFHGRYGFMEANHDVLAKISVSYADTLLKEYLFEYASSARGKTLLRKISESYDNAFRPSGGYPVKNYDHTFEYEQSEVEFGEAVTVDA
ncbi:MAG: hypothetical protein LBV02_02945, partial [Bacteroidales bacterium]|nr:hypothetical protein [Bacteroidales bacterium]